MQTYIPLLPSLGERSKEFVDIMRRLSRCLSRCRLGNRQPVIAKFRDKVCSALNRPQATQALEFSFAVNVILDYLTIGWKIRVKGGVVQIASPPVDDMDPTDYKDFIRQGHLTDRNAQLAEKSVVQFIRKMERRTLTPKGWHSIFSLMRDGAALSKELTGIANVSDRKEQLRRLAEMISPYIELVTEDARCPHTGLQLRDVWRYLRHTWVNAYNSIPGRSMLLLIRDAAAENHPVIGIAALGNAVAQQKKRDEWIGWDQDAFVQRVLREPSREYGLWILESLDRLIDALYVDDLFRDRICQLIDVDHPTDRAVERLQRESERAIKRHRLYPRAANHKARQRHSTEKVNWEEQARTNLFRSKRCKTLARLLRIRQVFQKNGLRSGSKEELDKALGSSAFRNALGQLVRMVKAEHVGIDMMDIVVCGSVAPYNVLLGGKLVCMLLCSPEVVKSYARRYGQRASVIASSMKGSPVIRPPHLVLLSTTSLYGVGSSQYNRVKIPCERIGGASGEHVEYLELGTSVGYGTYHFSGVSAEIAQKLVERRQSGRQVNSIFGEGANPRIRKLREAFDRVGLPSNEMLQHGNPRVVYGIALARNFRETLLGFARRPSYYFPLPNDKERTRQVGDYWRERWLLGRIGRPGILEEVANHTLAHPIAHGARVILPRNGEDMRLGFDYE